VISAVACAAVKKSPAGGEEEMRSLLGRLVGVAVYANG